MTSERVPPQVGNPAPDFTLPGVVTKPEVRRFDVSLSSYRGQKNVVLAFHPLAWTST